jgi:3-deoxy-manno-octulosonate cytidylyltransferase (CMP-KDO synthetase)
MKNFKILDCTLRDGGYYTNWKFDRELVRSLVRSLDSHNVDIIEMGYKSPVKGGEYRKCNDGFISSIIDFDIKAKLAFMIDVKDYVSDGIIDTDLVYDTIKPSSVFKICRIAAKENEIEYLPELISIISNMGYDVICNLMAVTRTSDSGILNYIDTIENLGVKAIYVADSYGALYPENVNQIFSTYPKLTGIHTHDNMGLAFANCISALNNGAEYIDGTLTGMGRGVGNVTTEKLLVHRGESISNTLLDCISKFNILKQKYGWGTNTIYHIAGKNHIHPLYMQDLNQSNLTSTQLLSVVNSLKECDKYDSNKLEQYKTQRSVVVIPARYKSSRFPGKPLAKINGKEMVIWVAEIAEKAVGVDNVYVATENEEISKVVKKYGYKVILTSDSCLTGTDRVAEASKEIDADIFINVQGDEPMVDPNDIIKVIDYKKKYPNHVINCMSDLHSDETPNDKKIPKVICDLDNNLVYCSRTKIPGNKNDGCGSFKKQVCIYGFSKQQLQNFTENSKTPLEAMEDIEIIRFLEKGIKVKMVNVDNVSYAVDYVEDIKIVEKTLKI